MLKSVKLHCICGTTLKTELLGTLSKDDDDGYENVA